MTTATDHPFAQRLAQLPDSRLLRADQPTGAPLMCMPEVEEQTEHYLAIEHGDSADRGMWTGALGGLGCFLFIMAMIALLNGHTQSAAQAFFVATACTVIPFLLEILRPMPLPILLNRRTRELYFEQEGEIYHTPWDGIAAATYAYATVGPYTAGMRHAALEAMLHRYSHPQEQVVINLGSPTGKSLEMQLGFWEYLRAYMNNGPWFDQQGQPSDSPEFNQSLLAVRKHRGHWTRLQWRDIKEQYQANGGRNFLSGSDFVLLVGSLFLAPLNAIQNFTYALAKRRARSQWPQMIRERLRADGPTNRLVDLESTISDTGV
ncbi:MAG: hypothetical protein ACN6P1_16000 [Pseudomonas sp.]|uniref:hypothetical protein n=1 Tax=Pseudomonas sp. TaxID=306 RepID=UPI003D0E9640